MTCRGVLLVALLVAPLSAAALAGERTDSREASLRRFDRFALGMTAEAFVQEEPAADCNPPEGDAAVCDLLDEDEHGTWVLLSGLFVSDRLIDLVVVNSLSKEVTSPKDILADAVRGYGPPDRDSATGPVRGFPNPPEGTISLRVLRWRSEGTHLLLDLRRGHTDSGARLYVILWFVDRPGAREWLRSDGRPGDEG